MVGTFLLGGVALGLFILAVGTFLYIASILFILSVWTTRKKPNYSKVRYSVHLVFSIVCLIALTFPALGSIQNVINGETYGVLRWFVIITNIIVPPFGVVLGIIDFRRFRAGKKDTKTESK